MYSDISNLFFSELPYPLEVEVPIFLLLVTMSDLTFEVRSALLTAFAVKIYSIAFHAQRLRGEAEITCYIHFNHCDYGAANRTPINK